MSWSIDLIGETQAVVSELTRLSGPMSGDSKIEYDAALPHMIGIVEQNYSVENHPRIIRIKANGHGHGQSRICNVNVETIHSLLV